MSVRPDEKKTTPAHRGTAPAPIPDFVAGPTVAGKSLALLRITTGFVFLWAFLDKLFGWGYATPSKGAWINGGSPTKGFLSHSTGPFSGVFKDMAGNGIVNWLIPGPPKSFLIFSSFAVIVTLAATYITYTTIPIYAAMKAIDPSMFESAVDLGAGWWVQTRRILIPLAAPGIFIAMILVYIPMLTDFVTADIVGGTGSYMMGQRVRDLILSAGDWGAGSALNIIMLVVSMVFSLAAYYLARLNRIQT